jgi:hypothetical protein
MSRKPKGTCHFSGNRAHSSQRKITIVVDSSQCGTWSRSAMDGPFEVSKILVYTLSFAFVFLYQRYMSSLGFCESIYTIANRKQFGKVSNNRFAILELLFDPKEEASR